MQELYLLHLPLSSTKHSTPLERVLCAQLEQAFSFSCLVLGNSLMNAFQLHLLYPEALSQSGDASEYGVRWPASTL